MLGRALIFSSAVPTERESDLTLLSGGRQSTGITETLLGTLYLEPGVPEQTVQRLKAMGHRVEVIENGPISGGYQAIAIDPENGSYSGATEMRKDGTVAAY